MTKDIIQILPDNVANQIAAGEVIQRPASIVKELIENSVDAGSTSIQLILKEAGKNLVQVVDNGCGMSPTDARVCFERHATSKISKADDLYQIKTKGFRGEAMASICSIAQVVLRSKRVEDEVGTEIRMEGSKLIGQNEIAGTNGTNTSVRNLFFNTPARRKFLKSNPVELKHCIEEFQRVALTHPEIEMMLVHNDEEVYHLPKSGLKQRIVHIFGKNYAQFLIPIESDTNVVNISGYLVKPEQAKKTRGEQYFFINHRYIKNAYLNHAISSAFQEVIPKEYYPGYVVYLEMDPSKIDINIHPTKTEVKFEDEKTMYAIIKSAVKKSIAQYGVMPSLDFDQETSFDVPFFDKAKPIKEPVISTNDHYNPFEKKEVNPIQQKRQDDNAQNWQRLYEVKEEVIEHTQEELFQMEGGEEQQVVQSEPQLFQIHSKYIISQIKSGVIIIHQQRAHERVLFDKLKKRLDNQSRVTQQLLFPENIELKADGFNTIKDHTELLKNLGFDFDVFGKNAFIFRGLPTDIEVDGLQALIEDLVFKLSNSIPTEQKNEQVLISMVKKASIKVGTSLKKEEMVNLVDQLFASSNSEFSPDKQKIIHLFPKKELDQFFNE